MKHLSNDEILNAVEHNGRPPHLDSCPGCRERVDELRRVLTATSDVEVPEPSPLFWDHFSARVREVIEAEASAPRRPSRVGWGWAATVASALAIIVIGVWVTMRTAQPIVAPTTTASAGDITQHVSPADSTAPQIAPLEEDATWALMGDIASELDWDEAREAGLTMRPGSADQAVTQMSEDEQRQVIALIKTELKKSKTL